MTTLTSPRPDMPLHGPVRLPKPQRRSTVIELTLLRSGKRKKSDSAVAARHVIGIDYVPEPYSKSASVLAIHGWPEYSTERMVRQAKLRFKQKTGLRALYIQELIDHSRQRR